MDQVWKGLSNLDPRDPGGFYKKTLLSCSFSPELKLFETSSQIHIVVSPVDSEVANEWGLCEIK